MIRVDDGPAGSGGGCSRRSRPGRAAAPAPAAAAPPACRPRRTGSGRRSSPPPPRSARSSPPPGSAGCWPASARRTRMRWTDSARFSHEPPSGVNSGQMPGRHQPVEQRRRVVPGQVVPDQQQPQRRQARPGPRATAPATPSRPPAGRARSGSGGGSAARIAVNSCRSHGCSTALGRWPPAARAPRRWPGGTASAAWRCRRGCTRGGGGRAARPAARRRPGCGMAWYGPASSWHHTGMPSAFGRPVGPLDHPLFSAACGSTTVDHARLPLALDHPGLAPGLRCSCQLRPASCSTRRMVKVLTAGSPSGARRSARCKVVSDQVAVPSCSRSGRAPHLAQDARRFGRAVLQRRAAAGPGRSAPPARSG